MIFEIPAWLVSIVALLSAGGIWTVRPIPVATKIGLSVPISYFSILYIFIATIPFNQDMKTTLVRAGLLVIFGTLLFATALYNITKNKGK